VCCDILLPDIYKTQQGSHCETMEHLDSRLLNQYVVLFKKYL